MHFTVNAFYTDADCDNTILACQIRYFDLEKIRVLLEKAKELRNTISDFSELVVNFPSWNADFITSFNDSESETENLVLDDSNTVPIRIHAEPIDRALYDYECSRHCNLHVNGTSFYFKSFEKHTGYSMETDWITLEDLTA